MRGLDDDDAPVIDNFSVLLTHTLMLLAAWRLSRRADLDREDDAPAVRFARRRGRRRGPGADA